MANVLGKARTKTASNNIIEKKYADSMHEMLISYEDFLTFPICYLFVRSSLRQKLLPYFYFSQTHCALNIFVI